MELSNEMLPPRHDERQEDSSHLSPPRPETNHMQKEPVV